MQAIENIADEPYKPETSSDSLVSISSIESTNLICQRSQCWQQKQVPCHSYGTVFFRLVASAYWRSRTLCPPNHVRYIFVRIYELHLYARMTTREDPKDFVCECLADLIDVLKIEHDRAESIDTE
jgi:hypothetical protein